MMVARMIVSWLCVAVFMLAGPTLLAGLSSPWIALALFVVLFGVIIWSAFGVVHEAEEVAHILGEPFGTLVLTLSIVVIEVALVSAVMLGPGAKPTLGRDTMFAVLMIVLNGVVGLGLFLGGLRHREQRYNLQGASAYLMVLIPLTCIALVLPNFTTSTPGGTLSVWQSATFSLFTLALYGVFITLQTGRHNSFFLEPGPTIAAPDHGPVPAAKGAAVRHTILLLGNILPIVLLSKSLAKVLDFGIASMGAPSALGGVLIAAIVFTPEAVSALRAVMRNELQRTINLCLGAATSTVGLTVPAILGIGLLTGQSVTLGLEPIEMVLLLITLVLSMQTFSAKRTTLLEGAVHLVMFFVYLVLVFNP
jgi:Ca2+:H+ antiporter